MPYKALYKCRMCGKTFHIGATTNDSREAYKKVMELAVFGKPEDVLGLRLLTVHYCKGVETWREQREGRDCGNIGIADFIGCEEVADAQPIIDKETWEKAQKRKAPEGYKWQDGKLVIDEEKAEIVRAKIAKFLKGKRGGAE